MRQSNWGEEETELKEWTITLLRFSTKRKQEIPLVRNEWDGNSFSLTHIYLLTLTFKKYTKIIDVLTFINDLHISFKCNWVQQTNTEVVHTDLVKPSPIHRLCNCNFKPKRRKKISWNCNKIELLYWYTFTYKYGYIHHSVFKDVICIHFCNETWLLFTYCFILITSCAVTAQKRKIRNKILSFLLFFF